jgi:hypothetical protein
VLDEGAAVLGEEGLGEGIVAGEGGFHGLGVLPSMSVNRNVTVPVGSGVACSIRAPSHSS